MRTHPAADGHPYVARLFVDLDPAGNPIGRGVVVFRRGVEDGTLWFEVPDPFDTIGDAFADLLTEYVDTIGTQQTLF